MMLYKIMLVLFIFGATVSGLNESGLFAYKMNEASGARLDEVQISEYTNSTTSSSIGSFNVLSAVFSFMKVIASGLGAVVAISFVLISYGVPPWIAGIIQAPIWVVELFGVYQLVTGNIGVER